MRAGVDAPKLVTEQRPDRQFDGSQDGEGRSAQPGVEVVERDDVAETGPGVKVVLAPRLGLLPERIPVPAQTVVVDALQAIRQPSSTYC